MKKMEFAVRGMHCASCAASVQRNVAKVRGVRNCAVNIATNTMVLEAEQSAEDAILKAVQSAGFSASRIRKQSDSVVEYEEESFSYTVRFLIALLFSVLLFYTAMHRMFGLPWFAISNGWTIVIQILLLIPILTAGSGFYRRGFPALLRFRPNMDSLIALSTFCAVLYSLIGLLRGKTEHLYFDTAGMIIALIMLGKFLEARSKSKASGAIRELMNLAPGTAEQIMPDGTVREVPAADLKPGDLLKVSPGGKIPVDGILTEGSGTVNESMLTGEPVPAEKQPGDRVTGGTIVLNGSFRFRADRTGSDTTLAHIIELVRNAQSSKPAIARIADSVSGYFVWGVILIALLTFCIWNFGTEKGFADSLGFALAVLVIACPCALGLATPIAIIAGIGRGAKLGILFRSGEAIETAGKTILAIFDKTGTLTVGEPHLDSLLAVGKFSGKEKELLRLIGSAAEQSAHPLAKAIAEKREKEIKTADPVSDFREFPGRGLKAAVAGHTILLGNRRLLSENKVDSSGLSLPESCSAVYAAVDGELAGAAAFSDQIRAEAGNVVKKLRRMGIHILMLTGDHPAAAKSVADQLHIHQFYAGLLPDEKQKTIQLLRNRGGVIAMVGDGINDAPSLAAADAGISLASGTDIAMETAGIVLMRADLNGVPQAVGLSRAVMRIIRENLFWAFLYNILCIPLAAGVFYPWFHWQLNPAAGAFAMALSSVTVVCNALRLRRWHLR